MKEWKGSFWRMSGETISQKGSNEEKLLSCLGLCVRAGKAVFGTPMICDAMRKGGASRPVTVFEAADTSENTHKKITDKCEYYKIKHIRLTCGGERLADALGKSSFLAAVAVTDEKMSMMVEKYI